jgi:hypothetical protein
MRAPVGGYTGVDVAAKAARSLRRSRRELMPSLAKIFMRCHPTVLYLMKSWLPISGLARPGPASSAI